MIKIYGLNYRKGSGDYCLFGHCFSNIGNGYGIRLIVHYNGKGDGLSFGDNFQSGNGWSKSIRVFKKEFLKND